MKLKILIFLTVVTIFIVGYFAFFAVNKSGKLQSPVSDKSGNNLKNSKKESENIVTGKTKEYIDPSGFKFSYPQNLKLAIVDKQDPAYYSSLNLKSQSDKGGITVDITTTKYKTLDEWVKQNKEIASNSRDLKLADLKAKEITSTGKRMVIAVDLETLITITASYGSEDQKEWQSRMDTIVSTFKFEQPSVQSENSSVESAGDDVVFEGEEMIE